MSSMDSNPMQNQGKVQDTHHFTPSLERKKSGIKALEGENHPHHYEQAYAHEKQSTISGFQKCEIGEKEEKLGTAHEEMVDGEQTLTENDAKMEERESEIAGAAGPRERLKRHRTEVAGQVWIPDMWGQEDFLKDWIDCSKFDSCLVTQKDIMSARSSLVQEGRRASSGRLRVENSC